MPRTAPVALPTPLVPASLPVVRERGRDEDGRRWLARLPVLIAEAAGRWELAVGPPFHGGSCSWAAPARRPDGTAAVLKVTWPHPEAEGEAGALRIWEGRGAARLLAEDASRHALLLERCAPGGELRLAHHLPVGERLASAADVLRELWAAPVPARNGPERLVEVAARWADLLTGRAARYGGAAADPGLARTGAELLRALPRSAGREVVLHGDFNPGNVLAARRRPWLAIDPKPLAGDPAYDPWPLLTQVDDPFAHGDPEAVLRRRTALVARSAGVDPARTRAWAVARQVEFALWSAAQYGDPAAAAEPMARAKVLARLAGV
jgi:streptomycin 6-kinase